ncbi:hypothetical protein BDV96DRAFT_605200 [Lophiotrema nucula]|uniref:Uncharacterized protein n=1 Tax=Lophiotrema nucula TaxID=690887 RepID=A0A6A5YPW8_9PLEO|nr:hypothetical protein BDV96DRAFT_605200 [Lophiotrema nucula]
MLMDYERPRGGLQAPRVPSWAVREGNRERSGSQSVPRASGGASSAVIARMLHDKPGRVCVSVKGGGLGRMQYRASAVQDPTFRPNATAWVLARAPVVGRQNAALVGADMARQTCAAVTTVFPKLPGRGRLPARQSSGTEGLSPQSGRPPSRDDVLPVWPGPVARDRQRCDEHSRNARGGTIFGRREQREQAQRTCSLQSSRPGRTGGRSRVRSRAARAKPSLRATRDAGAALELELELRWSTSRAGERLQKQGGLAVVDAPPWETPMGDRWHAGARQPRTPRSSRAWKPDEHVLRLLYLEVSSDFATAELTAYPAAFQQGCDVRSCSGGGHRTGVTLDQGADRGQQHHRCETPARRSPWRSYLTPRSSYMRVLSEFGPRIGMPSL